MMLKVAYFVNLVLARLLVWNEFGPRWPSTRPSLGVRTDNPPKLRFLRHPWRGDGSRVGLAVTRSCPAHGTALGLAEKPASHLRPVLGSGDCGSSRLAIQ
jgi:hypothetical protein